MPELVNGTNVLAFHAVNSNSTREQQYEQARFSRRTGADGDASDGGRNRDYMAAPTPGDDNGVGTLGFVDDTQFSVDRGFYTTPQSVAITTRHARATIRYTTDGSVPTLTNGTTYTGADQRHDDDDAAGGRVQGWLHADERRHADVHLSRRRDSAEMPPT